MPTAQVAKGRGLAAFSMLVTCYLFCGGAGAGAVAVLCVLECISRSPRFALSSLPDELFARAWVFASVLLGVGVLCLIADLGRPDRLLDLLTNPVLTPVSVGAWALAGSLACALFFFTVSWSDSFSPAVPVVCCVAVFGVACAAVTMAYTGVLLQGMASVLAWQTPLITAVFVLSSVSCGIACVLLSAVFVEARYPFVGELTSLVRLDGVLIAGELAVLAFYCMWALGAPGTTPAAHALLDGPYSALFWCGLVLAGLVAPLVMELFLKHGNMDRQLLWIAMLVLTGGFVLRLCVVGVSQFDVTQMSGELYGLSVISLADGNA